MRFKRLAVLAVAALLAIITVGCSDSDNDNFVFPNGGQTTGNVLFNFTRPQGSVSVPVNTTQLQFTFYTGINQTGTVTLDTTLPYANQRTVAVPTNSNSYRITARDVNGLPIQQTVNNQTVNPLQVTVANLATATTTAITLNTVTVTPANPTVAANATQQFAATGAFSNGDNLALAGVAWTSSIPARATIDAGTGLATGVSPGPVTITGTLNTVPGNTTLTVTAAPVADATRRVFVSNNGAGNQGNLDFFDAMSALTSTFTAGQNQGIALDALGTAYHSSDAPADRVRILSRIPNRTGAFDANFDREINLGFNAIKGSTVAQRRGLLIMADFGASSLPVIGTQGTQFVANPMIGVPPWDVAYDDANDRLYVALTNGSVGVFDNFVGNGFTPMADRTFTSTTAGANTNFHGIVFDTATGNLVVSDVGDPANGTDGSIFVFDSPATATGATAPTVTIAGPATQLGNPVDIDLAGTDLRVVDKSTDMILTFTSIFNSQGGNLAPTIAVAEDDPESITSQANTALRPDNSDIDGGVTVQNILVSRNPNNSLVRIDPGLTAVANTFATIPTFESVKVDGQGDAYVTFDTGLFGVGRGGTNVRDALPLNANRDAAISNTGTALKGLDVVDERGLVLVADVGGQQVLVFGKYGQGAAVFTTNTAAAGSPWDLDYDQTNDRLYVAFTNGTVGVYDGYFAGNPNTATPTRTITPNGSVNLHGIVHDAANDVLLLSDVGNVGDATDGQLFVVNGASTATGNVAPAVTIGGAGTNLGNPVDVAYDGTNLYVAEKSNNLVMRFDGIRASAGGTVAPSQSIAVGTPESVSLITGL